MRISVLITGTSMGLVSSNITGTEMNSGSRYVIGAMIEVLIRCYLIVAYTKPEKF